MLGFLVFGLFVGAMARLIVPGRHKMGLWMTLLLGVLGSVVGGVVANFLGTGDIWELNMLGGIVAIATAAALVAIGTGASADRKN
ncbi:MAG: hypothetical protein ACLGHT_08555 [Acidimicrobiia bacterium]